MYIILLCWVVNKHQCNIVLANKEYIVLLIFNRIELVCLFIS